MKRTLISLSLITVFVLSVVIGDLWFMTHYVGGINDRLDKLEAAEGLDEQKACAAELDDFFVSHNFWAHRLVPTGRMEELETLLHKLNAYIETEDVHEVEATVAELRARANLLYSTDLYHWYQPMEFRIE